MKKTILFYLFILNISLFAQMSDFEIMPHQINFVNRFEKIKTVRMFNNGTNNIIIDSISYDSKMLYIRNNNFPRFPLLLEPDSSISISILLANYFTLQGDDSTTIVNIYNRGKDPVKSVNVTVDFQMSHRMDGIIAGTVSDSLNYLEGAKVYFFYDGIYLVDSTSTDNNGYYEKELRYGKYLVSVKMDGYYLQFGELKYSLLDADYFEVRKESPQMVNFILEPEIETSFSISGVVYDIVTDATLTNAIVVVRKGDHNPTKIQASTLINPSRDYSVMTNSKGEFNIKNIYMSGDYYVQAFSKYYIPGYYNNSASHQVHWQNADSINVSGFESGKNIYLDRDSSFGGGVARGRVRKNMIQSDSTKNALIYAVSTSNNKAYAYSFSRSSGEFNLNDLPSGNYKLVTDKIGYESSISNDFFIGTTQDTVSYIDLLLLPTSIEHDDQIVSVFSLSQNYPNPFNPSTTIEFSIAKAENITLTIYNLLGQKVTELINGDFSAGIYKVTFDASQLSSGVYIYQLKSSSNIIANKMELLK